MKRRLLPLPREGRDADIAELIKQLAEIEDAGKNSAIVYRKLRLARAWQLRTQEKQEARAS